MLPGTEQFFVAWRLWEFGGLKVSPALSIDEEVLELFALMSMKFQEAKG